MGFPITQFAPNPSLPSFICLVCNNVAEAPLVLKCCQNLVCGACFPRMSRCTNGCAGKFKAKPISGAVKGTYGILTIKCSHSPMCLWFVSLSSLDFHIAFACNFRPFPCPNKNCNGVFPRAEFENHRNGCPYRLCTCVHCQQNVVFFAMDNHFRVCPSVLVPCPENKYCPKVARSALNKHLSVCPSMAVTCPWSAFGCDFVGKRWDLSSHLQGSVASHLKGVKAKLKDINPIEKEQINLVDDEEGPTTVQSNTRNVEKITESLMVVSLKEESEKLVSAFQVIQSQVANRRVKLENLNTEYNKLKDEIKKIKKENTDAKKQVTDLKNENTALKTRVENYEKKFKHAVVVEHFSFRTAKFETPTFTIDGLNWNLVIYPEGLNKDNHLSVFLNAVESRTAGWERRNVTYTVKLVVATNDNLSVKKTGSGHFDSGCNNWGWTKFVSLVDLRKVIVADSIFFEVSINA
eukprot:TRINITY_DN501_c0_g1_i1.p1 TRINITY_DN501_c0_g1~~TRINITY_DN501_c0_g1_i1.p1  ORF type:complete len:463 (+),score=51.32 TRINITY_DN501_c0_g1_i1:179-1567(+)